MHIILDLDNSSKDYTPASSIFFEDTIIEMARRHTDHSFILITVKQGKDISSLPANVTVHLIKNRLNWLSRKWGYKYVLKKELKKLKADLFVTVNISCLSNYGIPSYLFLSHLSDFDEPSVAKKKMPFKKQLTYSIQRATAIITLSDHYSQIIQQRFSVPAEKCKVLKPDLNEKITSLEWEEKENVKIQYARGLDYFAFAGDIHQRHDLISLLRAYSRFKKWQHSNMQLVITGNKTLWTEQLKEKLHSFKYRSDVHLIIDPPKEALHAIIGAAYAFVYPALHDHFPLNILRAMQAEIPVITSEIPVIQEIANNAVMYAKPDNTEGFAQSIQMIYKDEQLRKKLIDTAKNYLAQRSKNDVVEDCWLLLSTSFQSKS